LSGRVFEAHRPIRLSDTDAGGRLRLDAVARYLQDVAADDVADAGWSPDEHIWVVRRTDVRVFEPFVNDAGVSLRTWCSGVAAAAAARRYSLAGNAGGRIEAESIWIHLDHDQTYTASAGASYRWQQTRISADLISQSGLRASTDVPNGGSLPHYVTVNLGINQSLDLPIAGAIKLRFDVINLLDKEYEIRDGTGIGVGAPQFGARRGFFGGISKEF